MGISWRVQRARRGPNLSSGFGWLLVSLFIHAVILGALAFFKFGGVIAPPAPVKIDTDLVESFERQEPVTRRVVLDVNKAISDESRAAAVRKTLQGTGGDLPIIAVEKPDLAGLGLDLLGASKGGAEVGSLVANTSNLTRKIALGKPKDYQAVLDATAKAILATISRSRLLVVLLFDESRSLIEDRKIISQQLERIFEDLRLHVTDEEEKRLRWAVVSFSGKPTLWLQPTDKIVAVQRAIAKVKVDITGKENPIEGIRYCISKWKSKDKRMMILLVSDEAGDDAYPEPDPRTRKVPPDAKQPIELAIKDMRKNNVRLYVLGREAALMKKTVPEWIEVDGIRDWNWINRGYPSRRLEFLPPYRFHMPSAYQPSGFGCYPLSTLAMQTDGQFFVLSDKPSPWDEDRLAAYQPEWCTPTEYDRRTEKSKLRSTILRIVQECSEKRPRFEYLFVRSGRWEEQVRECDKIITRTDDYIAWCKESLSELGKLRRQRDREKHSRKRWQANYDMVIGQLYRLEFEMYQYRAIVRDLSKRIEKRKRMPAEKGKLHVRFWVERARRDERGRYVEKIHGGKDAQRALEKARKALSFVEREHAGTPWAAYAAYLKRDLVPVQLYLSTVPRLYRLDRPAM